MSVDPHHTFYVIKGVLGVIGVLALVFYMDRSWPHFDIEGGYGQRLRFITLFYFAVLVTAVSYDQVRTSASITLNSIGALGGAILLAITSVVSLLEARNGRDSR